MIKTFKTDNDFKKWLGTHKLHSGVLCYIEDDISAYFSTNNIDGSWCLYHCGGDGEKPDIQKLTVTKNGTYTTHGNIVWNEVDVKIPAPVLGTRTFFENGTYKPEDFLLDGFMKVTVDVDVPTRKTLNVTENGVYDGSKQVVFDKVNVNLPISDMREYVQRESTSFIIPNGTTHIGYYAFGGCIYLKRITIPTSVVEIKSYCFYSCDNLMQINDDEEYVLRIPDNIRYVGVSSFVATLFKKIIFGSNTRLERVPVQCFADCREIEEIVIPDNIKYIEGEAFFYGTAKCRSIMIGSGVVRVNNYAFCTPFPQEADCMEVVITATTPPTLGYNVFYDDDIVYNIKIYVPAESVDAYKTATNWKNYASSIFPIE